MIWTGRRRTRGAALLGSKGSVRVLYSEMGTVTAAGQLVDSMTYHSSRMAGSV